MWTTPPQSIFRLGSKRALSDSDSGHPDSRRISDSQDEEMDKVLQNGRPRADGALPGQTSEALGPPEPAPPISGFSELLHLFPQHCRLALRLRLRPSASLHTRSSNQHSPLQQPRQHTLGQRKYRIPHRRPLHIQHPSPRLDSSDLAASQELSLGGLSRARERTRHHPARTHDRPTP